MTYSKNKKFLNLPQYPGGNTSLKQYISRNLKYPEEAIENEISGTVYISYDVNDNGEVIRADVIKGIGYGCDDEALRLVKSLKFEKVKNRGQRVKATMKINIHFRLPIKNTLQKNTAVTYNYNTETPTPHTENPSPIVYNYTITLNSSENNEQDND